MAAIAHFLDTAVTPLNLMELPAREEPALANRRSLPRIAGRFEVRLHEDGSAFHGLDLSFGGLMCAGASPIWPGNLIDFDLVLPGEARPLALHGRVVELVAHRGALAMRLRFEGIGQADRKRIALWMARSQGV